jgi:hypothetical protein
LQRPSAQTQRSTSLPSTADPPTQQSDLLPSSSTADDETVIIEEKRRRPSGEGYTLHRYLRGRLLGKGGFAKVYLCTALDTNKAYAVKIVPKANLVKARARQKVCIIDSVLSLSEGTIFPFIDLYLTSSIYPRRSAAS